jgi:hypothetical protein
MHNPRLESGRTERPLDGKMIVASTLYRHDLVSDTILAERLSELQDGQLETTSCVQDFGGLDEHFSIEVAKHYLRFGLAHIDTHNSETLGPNFLHPRVENAVGLLDASTTGSTTLGTGFS